jgi:hypothetical protein
VSQFAGEQVVAEVTGPFGFGPEYRGCPLCQASGYVKCGTCNRLSCWPGSGLFTCGWCGNQGVVNGEIESLQRVD